VSRLLVAQRALTVPGWIKDALWRRAQAVPSLDLRFADNKSLTDAVTGQSLVTFTRASSGTFTDSAGTLQTAATDVPRFDHNPTTGESLGLLVEEARTNSIRNNTGVGAVAGTPGTLPTNWSAVTTQTGLSREIVGTGTENGISYIDIRISGTATATDTYAIAFEQVTEIVASTGQSWTASVYTRISGGSTTGVTGTSVRVRERTISGVVLGSTLASSTNPANLKDGRSVATRVLSDATATRVNSDIAISYSNGAVIDITIRIGLPQLEQGAFATSPIPTTTATATRAADVVSITGAAFSSWYRQDEGTVFVDALRTYSGNFPAYPNIYNFNDGTANNSFALYGIQGTQNITNSAIQSGGAAQTDFVQVVANVPGPNRIAQALAVNSSTLAGNGTLTLQDNSVALPVGINRVNIGSDRSPAAQWGGTIKRLTYWPQALPSRLQSITQ
jgi:hypothetical protein